LSTSSQANMKKKIFPYTTLLRSQEKKRIKDAYLVKVGQQYINLLKLTNPEIEYEEVGDYLAKKIIEVKNKEKEVKDSKNTNGNFDLSTSQNDFNEENFFGEK